MSEIVCVDFCCNDPDTGMFTGEFHSVQIGDGLLELSNQFWPPKTFKLSYDFHVIKESHGFGASQVKGRVKVSRRYFPIIGYKYGWGNWCWDLVIMRPIPALRLVNYLKSLRAFCCEQGETRWFNTFNDPDAVFDEDPNTWLRMLAKWGYQAP